MTDGRIFFPLLYLQSLSYFFTDLLSISFSFSHPVSIPLVSMLNQVIGFCGVTMTNLDITPDLLQIIFRFIC